MDVMRPQIVWVNGAAYRLNTPSTTTNSLPAPSDYHDYNEEEEDMEPISEPSPLGDSADLADSAPSLYGAVIERTASGQFKGRLSIPAALHGSLIGRGGRSLRQTELRSRCRVRVPRDASAAISPVRVSGMSAADVCCACTLLTATAERARRGIAASHFVGVRLAGSNNEIARRYQLFYQQVIGTAAASRVGGGAAARSYDPQLLQRAERLHVTVCVLTLLNAAERRCVIDRLQKLLQPASLAPAGVGVGATASDSVGSGVGGSSACGGAIRLRVHGLDVMNDDPAQARVLYARVYDSENRLQLWADSISAELGRVAGGAHRDAPSSVKLHCTLMNASFLLRGRDECDAEYTKLARTTFDARPLLDQWGDYDFGSLEVDTVYLLQRHSFGDDGFYTSIAQFNIPQ